MHNVFKLLTYIIQYNQLKNYGEAIISCQNLKKGDVLVCEECGLEVKVTKACHCGDEEGAACTEEGFICCGGPMKVK
jgi:hypothetical protein